MNLTQLVNFVKSNKLASLAGTFTVIGMLVTAIWAVDARYAKAADVGKVERGLEANNLQMQIQLNKQAIRSWQDKIDDVDDKTVKTPDDTRKKQRWERQIQELKDENQLLQKQQFELRTR